MCKLRENAGWLAIIAFMAIMSFLGGKYWHAHDRDLASKDLVASGYTATTPTDLITSDQAKALREEIGKLRSQSIDIEKMLHDERDNLSKRIIDGFSAMDSRMDLAETALSMVNGNHKHPDLAEENIKAWKRGTKALNTAEHNDKAIRHFLSEDPRFSDHMKSKDPTHQPYKSR